MQSIDGLAGGQEDGRPVDWFYYVNGIEAPQGGAATNVLPGDHIWWDRHDWSQTEDVPAVVGSFPEPFLNGIEGKRLPVRLECESVAGYACRTINQRLLALGVPAAISAPAPAKGRRRCGCSSATGPHIESDPEAARSCRGRVRAASTR